MKLLLMIDRDNQLGEKKISKFIMKNIDNIKLGNTRLITY